MPIEPLPDSVRDRLAQSLREWAALVREEGWPAFQNVWSSGEVAGVRAVLSEPGAVDTAVPVWAATLWGIAGAEADAAADYPRTREWFALVIADAVADAHTPPTHVVAMEPRGGTVLRITHQSGLIHDSDLAYTGATAEAIQAARVIHGGVVVQLAEGTHHIAGHELEEHALYGCPGECGWKPGDTVVIRRRAEGQ
ncbi:hypothetical protein [Mycobacteroides abscessus]|uniref:hypothetical protein n=1 Tax=Mycobacteroides abscessus TaxID=36809 RepID=UPI0009A6E042|nr:hypothetical protein [Mycobacteroides abscessus]